MAGFGGSVKLKGESEYRRALKQITQNLKEVSSEMKAVSSAYDKGDNSTEAVANKTEALTKVLDAQKQKLKTLQDQYQSMSKQMAEQSANHAKLQSDYDAEKAKLVELGNTLGTTSKEYQDQEAKVTEMAQALSKSQTAQDANERSMSNMRVSINRAQADVNKTTNELKQLGNATEEAGEQAEDSSGGYTVLKGTLADLASQGIQMLVSSLKDFAVDSSEAYAQFSAQTGIAIDNMGKYKTAIDNVYKSNFGESLQDVAEKMGRLKEVTGELDASKLEDMTKKAMTLEDTFGMDFTETVRGAQSLMTHFGLTGEEAFDLISSGAQNGLNYSDELGDNLSEYAGKFAEAGYSAEDYFQLLQNGSQGGAYNLDKVNDAINEVTTRLGDGTIEGSLSSFSTKTQDLFHNWQDGKATQKDVIDSIVSDIKNATSEQDKMNLSALAFGTMAEDGGTKFVQSLTSVGDSYDNVKGKADELAQVKYDTPISAIQGIGRKLQVDLLQPIANDMMPTLNNVASWVSDNLPKFTSTIQKINGKVKDLMPIIAGVGVALGGLKLASMVSKVDSLSGAILTVVQSTKAYEIAQGALNLVMNANPIMLVVTALAGLATAFVLAYKNSETFRNIVNGAFSAVKDTVVNVCQAVSSFVSSAWNAISSVTSSVWNGIRNTITSVVNGVMSTVTSVVNGIRSTVTSVWNGIRSSTSSAWNAIKSAITQPIQTARSTVSGIVSSIRSTVSGIFNGIRPRLNLSLPHVSVDGGQAPWGIGGKGRLPSFNVAWYARGGVFDNGARIIGLGEDGAEAIVPLEKNTKWIKRVAEQMRAMDISASPQYVIEKQTNSEGISNDNYDRIVNAFKDALGQMKIEMDDEEMGKFVDRTVTNLVYD